MGLLLENQTNKPYVKNPEYASRIPPRRAGATPQVGRARRPGQIQQVYRYNA